jgi:hypothetical protein
MTSVMTWLRRLTVIALAGCMVIFMIAGDQRDVRYFLMNEGRYLLTAAGFAACFAAGVVVHELGHLACAAIGSIPVYSVVIGEGPVLFRRRIRDIWFEVRRWPVSGCVEPYAVADYRWHWWALFLMGGALANLVFIGLAFGLYAVSATALNLPLVLFVGTQVCLIAMTMVPSSYGGGNDGMQLVRLPWRPGCDSAGMRAAYDARIAGCSPGRAPPMTAASMRLLHHARRFWADGVLRAEVRDDLLHELERGDLSPAERSWVLDARATEDITSGETAVLTAGVGP